MVQWTIKLQTMQFAMLQQSAVSAEAVQPRVALYVF